MNGLIDQLRREVGRLGGAGVVGIGLIVFAMTFYFSAYRPPASTSRTERRSTATAGAAAHGRVAHRPRGRAGGAARDLLCVLPNEASTPQWLARIYAAAAAKGLALESGEYKLEHKVGERLARYEILLPVKGSYAQIRGFVAEVLATVPAAVLEEVNLRRESIQSPRLDARVRFALYLGGAE